MYRGSRVYAQDLVVSYIKIQRIGPSGSGLKKKQNPKDRAVRFRVMLSGVNCVTIQSKETYYTAKRDLL